MKFTISYIFKLKMAQNLSGLSGPVMAYQGRSVLVPIGADRRRCRRQTARNAVFFKYFKNAYYKMSRILNANKFEYVQGSRINSIINLR